MDQGRTLFAHQSLPSDTSFRVLELLPDEHDLPISCRLHIADLNRPPKYEAISYTWGQAGEAESIVCDGNHAAIQPNLYSALRQLRSRYESRMLWADAICINQYDSGERNQQVGNMLYIFRKAQRVLVWLGLDSEGAAGPAIETMQDLQQGWLSATSGTAMSPQYSGQWICLRWLLSRPWFSRIWVVQEVVSNPEVLALCGHHSIEWKLVEFAARHLRQFNNSQVFHHYEFWRSEIWSADTMLNRSLRRPAVDNLHRLELMNGLRRFHATDQRDKVFALLGMEPFRVTQGSMDRNSTISWVPVDYGKTLEQVYRGVAEAVIFSEPMNLDPLSYVLPASDATTIFPSWVPRWDQINSVHVLLDHLNRHSPRTNCSKGLSVSINKHSGDDAILEVGGIQLDTVEKSIQIDNELWFAPEKHELESSPFLRVWQGLEHESVYPAGQSIDTALSLVFTAGMRGHGFEALEHHTGQFLAWLTGLRQRYGEDSANQARALSDGPIHGDGSRKWARSAQDVSWNRSFFTTRRGYIGLGPKSVEKGDGLCVLGGGRVPHLLRAAGSNTETFRLVGECYVHGIMEGEAVQGLCEDGLRTFQII